jgi:Post-segregation antitoxin CcdA
MRMNISVPDDLAAAVRELDLPISAVCQAALRAEVDNIVAVAKGASMRPITVETGEPAVTQRFTGRWLVEPDREGTRSRDARDKDAYWGVALTRRGRFAIYVAHRDDRWPARLNDYDTLDEAFKHAPRDIIDRAAAELGETQVVWRDI